MKSATLTVNSWEGDLPLPGEFVKSARGRTAFMILMVKPSRPGSKTVGKFICERYPASALPADARVHEWVWSKR